MAYRKNNTNEVFSKLKTDYPNIPITKVMIQNILYISRLFIANYYKDLYKIETISSKNEFSYFVIDESDFVRIKSNS